MFRKATIFYWWFIGLFSLESVNYSLSQSKGDFQSWYLELTNYLKELSSGEFEVSEIEAQYFYDTNKSFKEAALMIINRLS